MTGRFVVGQQARGMAQPRAHQILVRGDAEHAGEQPQEMERAEARPGRRRASSSICRCECASIQSAVSTARRRSLGAAGTGFCVAPRHHLDETVRQQLADLVEPDIAAAVGRCLREFAEHHQFGQRRCAPIRQTSVLVADRFHQFGRQEERQAFVAAGI